MKQSEVNLATLSSSNPSATPSIESSVDEGLDDEYEEEERDMEALATPRQKKRKTQKVHTCWWQNHAIAKKLQ